MAQKLSMFYTVAASGKKCGRILGGIAIAAAMGCETPEPPPTDVPQSAEPVIEASPEAGEFPTGETEIQIPFPGGFTGSLIKLDYDGVIVPRVGDKATVESGHGDAWTEAGRARVVEVTPQQIHLRMNAGTAHGAARVRIHANAIHRCDMQAASSMDDRAVMPGVAFEEIPISAIEFCGQAVSKYPRTPRFHFQLGRALDAHGQENAAFVRYRHCLQLQPDYAAAMLVLAGKYLHGDGVERDVDEAVGLLHRAYETGLPRAAYMLGRIHEEGLAPLSGDREQTLEYYTMAAEAGDVRAQLRLAEKYEQGERVRQDLVEAMDWYQRAAESGHPTAQYRLGKAYAEGRGRPQDWQQARLWWEKAANHRMPEAQTVLAGLYEHGYGMQAPDLQRALFWYRQAAGMGYPTGQYHLGRMYALGLGVERDTDTARKWLLLARENGIADAMKLLEPEKPEQTVVAEEKPVREAQIADAEDNADGVERWWVQTQGYMDKQCREVLIDELHDLDIHIVKQNEKADLMLIISMGNPEHYSNSFGPLRFSGYNIHYRAEVIRKRDNIRLFYAHGEEKGDDRNESCEDALDEIFDELEDEDFVD